MSFSRPIFGLFHETIKVDGETYSYETYASLDFDARAEFRQNVMNRCLAANQRATAEFTRLSADIHKIATQKSFEVRNQPKYATRYKGRANDMQRELDSVRRWRLKELERIRAQIPKVDGVDYPALLADMLNTWENRAESPQEKFERLLASVDWYSHYSDDYSIYTAGERKISELLALAKQLGPEAEARVEASKPR